MVWLATPTYSQPPPRAFAALLSKEMEPKSPYPPYRGVFWPILAAAAAKSLQSCPTVRSHRQMMICKFWTQASRGPPFPPASAGDFPGLGHHHGTKPRLACWRTDRAKPPSRRRPALTREAVSVQSCPDCPHSSKTWEHRWISVVL